MSQNFSAWLNAVNITNPLERRQAGLVQVMLIGLMASVVLAIPLSLSRGIDNPFVGLRLVALLLIFATAAGSVALVRSGRFRTGIMLSALGLIAGLACFAVLQGVMQNIWLMLAMCIPLSLVGLLLGRWALVFVTALIAAMIGTLAALESMPGHIVGFAPNSSQSWPMTLFTFVLLGGLLSVFFDRFSTMLRASLAEALDHTAELEQLRSGLEQTVAARTAELQATVDQLQASQATVRELGAPVLPVLPGVLAAPIIGAVDSARAADLSAAVLEAIDRTRAQAVIFDITGVPVVDTQVAQALLKVAQAARLLGAEALLVGVSAEVAQTMVTLGVSLGAIRVFPNLQEAIAGLLAEQAAAVSRRTHGDAALR